MWLYEREVLELDDILDFCGFSARTFYRVFVKLWRQSGDVAKPHSHHRGRPRL